MDLLLSPRRMWRVLATSTQWSVCRWLLSLSHTSRKKVLRPTSRPKVIHNFTEHLSMRVLLCRRMEANIRVKASTDLDRLFLLHLARSLKWLDRIPVNSLRRLPLIPSRIHIWQLSSWLWSKKVLLIQSTTYAQTNQDHNKWPKCFLPVTIQLWAAVSSSFHITIQWMSVAGLHCKSSTR